MSQINTDNDDNCGWTPVRSKKMIKSLKEKEYERPPTPGMVIVSSPLRGSPTFCEQISIIANKSENIIEEKFESIIETDSTISQKIDSISEKTNSTSEKSDSTSEKIDSISEKTENIIEKKSENIIEKMKTSIDNTGNNVKPIINKAVEFLDGIKTQMINKTNDHNKDQWEIAFEFLKVQQTILTNSLNVVSNELKYPYFLRGKSDEQRNIEINDRLYKIVDDILIKIKDARVKENKWIDIMTPGKITGMIISSDDMHSRIKLLTNISEITNQINESCDILFQENKKTIKIVASDIKKSDSDIKKSAPVDIKKSTPSADIKKTDAVPQKKEPVPEKITSSSQKNDDSPKIFTIDERIDHKKNLVAGQEVFFKSCLPTEDEVEKIKEIIKTNKNWSGYVHKIDISEDEIKINNHSFSKKQYINNVFFQKRLKTKFYQIFNPKNISFFFSKKNPSIININATFE